MRMRNGDRRLRGVAAAGRVALLLASAAAVNGQSVSNFDRFQLYNACRPMGLRGGFSGSGHEDSFNFEMTTAPILPAVENRLREERLYSPLKSASNGAFLKVSAAISEMSPDTATHIAFLQYHKPVTDPASGLENTAATWKQDIGSCCNSHDPESIRESFTYLVDRFLEEYRRVNGKDRRPPSLTATGLISCAGEWDGAECWMELSNAPGCDYLVRMS